MITWFDALLVTLLAAITTMGIRRGLVGALWAVFTLAALLLVNLFSPAPLIALLLAALLGLVAAWGAQRLIPEPVTQFWQLGVGGLGGLALGAVVVAALALGFPIRVLGNQGSYPASTLPGPVYYALYNSYFVSHLSGVWSGNKLLRLLIVPDRAR